MVREGQSVGVEDAEASAAGVKRKRRRSRRAPPFLFSVVAAASYGVLSIELPTL
jgi:hypothetical protein